MAAQLREIRLYSTVAIKAEFPRSGLETACNRLKPARKRRYCRHTEMGCGWESTTRKATIGSLASPSKGLRMPCKPTRQFLLISLLPSLLIPPDHHQKMPAQVIVEFARMRTRGDDWIDCPSYTTLKRVSGQHLLKKVTWSLSVCRKK